MHSGQIKRWVGPMHLAHMRMGRLQSGEEIVVTNYACDEEAEEVTRTARGPAW